ncbi:MAG: ASCH domain-containing protein [Christensenellales bacterium]
MKLWQEPFDKIKKREKTIELRLYDEKRRLLSVGDKIRFTLVDDDSQTIDATVVNLYLFSSFRELLSTDLFDKCGCGGTSIDQAVSNMRKYYTEKQEEEYGVVGIEIDID